ncbi:prolyl oligopeptidase family serine peptidase [Streptomyces sp. J2-1]|uniref:S9 family peptidase n=1 Tax=Streptomyces corallincola TaxID=2851888 RepID=UPI001C388715|nr:prolyl oligopeptidase family serine peptidase [Streptomyces corallincola]MBV2355514.1 prolyl oligopeptidase family serine peptidase [Streptomyces corallincola]
MGEHRVADVEDADVTDTEKQAYGSWPSPIDAALAAAHDGQPEWVGFVGDEVWWTEPRPAEAGRRALVRRRGDGTEETVLPAPWNVRNRVHEYGGRPWDGVPDAGAGPGGADGDGGTDGDGGPLVVFTHFADQRLYSWRPGTDPVPLTPAAPVSAAGGALRWAEPRIDLGGGEVRCVLEEFTGDGPDDVRRLHVAVPLDGSAAGDRAAVRELTDGRHRFVTGLRVSPDGRRAAWLAWDHPRMPWDGTELLVGEIGADGTVHTVHTVAGGPDESVAQVEWSSDGGLLYTSDRSGWWNLYRDGTPLHPREEEFAGPLWKLGLNWFAPLDNGLVAVVHGRGATSLGILDPESGDLVDAAGPWTEFAGTLAAHGGRVAAVGAGHHTAPEVVELDIRSGRARAIGSRHHDPVDPAYYPRPRVRVFTGPDGREVHAQVYPPHHPHRTAPDGELPPYVIWAHGGPTSRIPAVLDLEIAYFTSRGIGVAEVNYGGSTGYGRAYRERLRGQWGVVDVEDCAAVARALADEGTADPARLAIRGGSAGGWTTAASLTTTDVYACGTIIYPVLDLTAWGPGDTHDFESRYLESLIGPRETVPDRYAERSPVTHADRLTAPFVLLQGLDDVICPPAQCERFLGRIAGRGVPHRYLTFEGEGHGFRRADTMIRALEAELSLYAQVFGLDVPGLPELELRP